MKNNKDQIEFSFVGTVRKINDPKADLTCSCDYTTGITISGYLIPFNKVVMMRLRYSQQNGWLENSKPTKPTVNGHAFDPKEMCPATPLFNFPKESMLERAKRRGVLDIWTPNIDVELTHGRRVTFKGNYAETIHQQYMNYVKSKGNRKRRSSKVKST